MLSEKDDRKWHEREMKILHEHGSMVHTDKETSLTSHNNKAEFTLQWTSLRFSGSGRGPWQSHEGRFPQTRAAPPACSSSSDALGFQQRENPQHHPVKAEASPYTHDTHHLSCHECYHFQVTKRR